ncbi:hypothetical protein AJ80_07701 [Polytolypa hystricis UAMH7299]|uniref:Uncharacterized protein n=1 Tax=Polytolypa hystricis (strain UAMH7299) TaxID=1447883 RepID=A0A2B7XKG9_POLH7|nr:hypothetical protein AJ80_07701 [Polytolypa hystricis UAMH7299]
MFSLIWIPQESSKYQYGSQSYGMASRPLLSPQSLSQVLPVSFPVPLPPSSPKSLPQVLPEEIRHFALSYFQSRGCKSDKLDLLIEVSKQLGTPKALPTDCEKLWSGDLSSIFPKGSGSKDARLEKLKSEVLKEMKKVAYWDRLVSILTYHQIEEAAISVPEVRLSRGVKRRDVAVQDYAKNTNKDIYQVRNDLASRRHSVVLLRKGGPGDVISLGGENIFLWKRKLSEDEIECALDFRDNKFPNARKKCRDYDFIGAKAIIYLLIHIGWDYIELSRCTGSIMTRLFEYIDKDKLAGGVTMRKEEDAGTDGTGADSGSPNNAPQPKEVGSVTVPNIVSMHALDTSTARRLKSFDMTRTRSGESSGLHTAEPHPYNIPSDLIQLNAGTIVSAQQSEDQPTSISTAANQQQPYQFQTEGAEIRRYYDPVHGEVPYQQQGQDGGEIPVQNQVVQDHFGRWPHVSNNCGPGLSRNQVRPAPSPTRRLMEDPMPRAAKPLKFVTKRDLEMNWGFYINQNKRKDQKRSQRPVRQPRKPPDAPILDSRLEISPTQRDTPENRPPSQRPTDGLFYNEEALETTLYSPTPQDRMGSYPVDNNSQQPINEPSVQDAMSTYGIGSYPVDNSSQQLINEPYVQGTLESLDFSMYGICSYPVDNSSQQPINEPSVQDAIESLGFSTYGIGSYPVDNSSQQPINEPSVQDAIESLGLSIPQDEWASLMMDMGRA